MSQPFLFAGLLSMSVPKHGAQNNLKLHKIRVYIREKSDAQLKTGVHLMVEVNFRLSMQGMPAEFVYLFGKPETKVLTRQ